MIQAEFGRFVRFCLVGVANTGAHMAVVLLLVERLHWQPARGNVGAFLCANLFSYLVNSRWTFASMQGDRTRYPRFLAVSLVGLTISWSCVKIALLLNQHYLLGVAASVVIVSIVGYVLNRLFVFPHA
ncbi:GtrA family protein [Uliginosibacterium sp. 31-16]|uniref:GtrA family protein n=1 Tax=Uliginosibacterium sp. 31-16 TaxID=3068315 RepID=UPI00273D9636|nr:GtrA family protein [Uliginosibacterium sp. 31-16]MDP5240146.1 GtrA family protein [Uliginosibacterium sp. 31-16]